MISALSAATSSVHSLETSRLNLQMIQLPGMGHVRSGHVTHMSLILKQTRAIEASVGVWPILHGLREGISWWLEEVVHNVRAQAFRPVSNLPAASPCDAGSHTLLFLDRI